MPAALYCPKCNERNPPIGMLGNTAHYRCRACGWFYSQVQEKRLPAKFRNNERSAA